VEWKNRFKVSVEELQKTKELVPFLEKRVGVSLAKF
jgi:hypothetical protein